MALPLAGAKILAADLAAIFPQGVGAWTTYAPTLVQSGAVPKTIARATYTKIGRFVTGDFRLQVTGAGGVAANEVRIGFPVAPASVASQPCGFLTIFDASASAIYRGMCLVDNAGYLTALNMTGTGVSRLGAADFTAALATGDVIGGSFFYEAAS